MHPSLPSLAVVVVLVASLASVLGLAQHAPSPGQQADDSHPPMREWLVVLTATEAVLADEPSPEAIRAVGEHYQRLVRLRDEGTVILAGRTMDAEPMGLVIYRARTAEEARALSNADPAVAGGFMIAEVRPYAVAVWGEHAITPPRG